MSTFFVVARTGSNRPSLQHATKDHDTTLCGQDISNWSRAYMATKIKEILCKKCSQKLIG